MTNDKGTVSTLFNGVRNSQLLSIILVGFLVLLLQIPVKMIDSVVGERASRRQEAVNEVASKWGEQQNVAGPMLTVPYLLRYTEPDKDGVPRPRTRQQYATFLPDDLHISADVNGSVRYRGIFKVPLYTTAVDITGRFARPDFSEWGVLAEDILWDRAQLTLRISDARAITNAVTLQWNDSKVAFLPGVGEFGGGQTGIHAPMKGCLSSDSFTFSCRLNLNGSGGIYFAPFGRQTTVQIASNWSDPSFQGNWLPAERTIGPDGFKATWNIPFLGRNYPQQWRAATDVDRALSESAFGVAFIAPVDEYRMVERSVKYEVLFLSLTFLVLWLFERLRRMRIHSVQYLLVGAGLCVFYLLELSLAEHIGFTAAYACASLAVTALVFVYCVFVLGGHRSALIMAGVLLLLYGYLYIVLMNQDYALLIGSICLFVAVAVVMWITRKIDWYSPREAPPGDVAR